MIVKGKLKQISSGFGKTKSTVSKYDFIEIGNFMIRDVKMDSYLSDRMENLLGEEIEVSILKPWVLMPKSLVAVKTENGTVYRNERSMRLGNGVFGYIIVALFSLPWLIIPYFILFSLIYSMTNNGYTQNSGNGLFTIFIIGHSVISILLTNYLKRAYNAFGKENSGHTVV
mgnify:CR=1 FL=1